MDIAFEAVGLGLVILALFFVSGPKPKLSGLKHTLAQFQEDAVGKIRSVRDLVRQENPSGSELARYSGDPIMQLLYLHVRYAVSGKDLQVFGDNEGEFVAVNEVDLVSDQSFRERLSAGFEERFRPGPPFIGLSLLIIGISSVAAGFVIKNLAAIPIQQTHWALFVFAGVFGALAISLLIVRASQWRVKALEYIDGIAACIDAEFSAASRPNAFLEISQRTLEAAKRCENVLEKEAEIAARIENSTRRLVDDLAKVEKTAENVRKYLFYQPIDAETDKPLENPNTGEALRAPLYEFQAALEKAGTLVNQIYAVNRKIERWSNSYETGAENLEAFPRKSAGTSGSEELTRQVGRTNNYSQSWEDLE